MLTSENIFFAKKIGHKCKIFSARKMPKNVPNELEKNKKEQY